MARLTEPGLYVSRDGRRAMSYKCVTGLAFAISRPDEACRFCTAGDMGTEGEWLPVELPKFQEPPKKPRLVYGKCPFHGPCWWMIEDDKHAIAHCDGFSQGYTAYTSSLEIIYDPDAARKEVNDAD